MFEIRLHVHTIAKFFYISLISHFPIITTVFEKHDFDSVKVNSRFSKTKTTVTAQEWQDLLDNDHIGPMLEFKTFFYISQTLRWSIIYLNLTLSQYILTNWLSGWYCTCVSSSSVQPRRQLKNQLHLRHIFHKCRQFLSLRAKVEKHTFLTACIIHTVAHSFSPCRLMSKVNSIVANIF